MAQLYLPTRFTPLMEASHDSVLAGLNGDRQLKVEDIQEAYIESKDRCVFNEPIRSVLTIPVACFLLSILQRTC